MKKHEINEIEIKKEEIKKEEMNREERNEEERNKKEMSRREMNEEETRKLFKQLNNDERLHLIENKVKCIAYEILAQVVWILGAIAVVLPPQKLNIIPISILVVMGVLLLLNNILYHLYVNDKLDIYSRPNGASRIVKGIMINLVLVLLLVLHWINVGLSGVGIVFLAVLVIFIALSFVNLRNVKKYD